MNFKKLFGIIFLATLLIGSGSSLSVLADNHGDTSWANQYRVWSPYDHTPARKKTNKTAYYNRTNTTNVGYITIWAALYDGRNVSGGHSYRSYAGTSTKLWNNAVENYGSGVSVRIDSSSWNNGSASGVWSPDSI